MEGGSVKLIERDRPGSLFCRKNVYLVLVSMLVSMAILVNDF